MGTRHIGQHEEVKQYHPQPPCIEFGTSCCSSPPPGKGVSLSAWSRRLRWGDSYCSEIWSPKTLGVAKSDRLAPKIHQSTESLKVPIGQNNLNGKFGLNLINHDMPPHDSRRNKSHRSVKGVPKGYFFPRGLLQALLATSALLFPLYRLHRPYRHHRLEVYHPLTYPLGRPDLVSGKLLNGSHCMGNCVYTSKGCFW